MRIITDRAMAKNSGSMVADLAATGIPLRQNRKHKIEHNKFAVFDGARIITGSYNWTLNATKHNSENCIVLNALGSDFSRRFEYLWDLYGN